MGDPFLAEAIEQAKKGFDDGGIPIGSVLVHDGKIIVNVNRGRVTCQLRMSSDYA